MLKVPCQTPSVDGLAAAGVLVLTHPWQGGGDPLGIVFALGAAACWAAYIVLSARVGRAFAGGTGLAMAMVLGRDVFWSGLPAGPITLEGTRRNARMVVEYVEGWLNGRGAKGIDSLAGKPGVHPALMEDLATGRMSVAQIAQRVRHRAPTTEGPAADYIFEPDRPALLGPAGGGDLRQGRLSRNRLVSPRRRQDRAREESAWPPISRPAGRPSRPYRVQHQSIRDPNC